MLSHTILNTKSIKNIEADIASYLFPLFFLTTNIPVAVFGETKYSFKKLTSPKSLEARGDPVAQFGQ